MVVFRKTCIIQAQQSRRTIQGLSTKHQCILNLYSLYIVERLNTLKNVASNFKTILELAVSFTLMSDNSRGGYFLFHLNVKFSKFGV